ncbi:unnamed protein product [Rangifer tarandus platyrhynchus]|uniref:Uncharacterized protein n=1 Tax=Rangifer tarandus platyrhynchus TaxID=3082113 RepID=A0ABN8YY68_RANTA|nr:unnamed protein product [Rangifer tarandus platyrhynchus]
MQSDVANERNWTATQRNQLFAELGAARGFQRLKVSSPGWKMRGRGVGGKAWEPVAARLRAGAHGGSQLARRPGARGRSVPREARSPGSSSAPGRAAGERRAPPDSVPAVSRRRGAAAGKGQPCEVREAPSHLVFLGLAGGGGGRSRRLIPTHSPSAPVRSSS